MSESPIDFSQAQYEGQSSQARTCAACSAPLTDSYWTINGIVTCAKCKDGVHAFGMGGSPVARTAKAIALGCVGGAVGAALWYVVAHFLNFQAGLVALAIGFLVGGGVRMGAERVGGWFYQLMAIGISYAAIVAGWFPSVVEQMRGEPDRPEGLGLYFVSLILALIAPLMNSVMGAIITLIALYEAWKLNKRPTFDVVGPLALSASPAGQTAAPPPIPNRGG